MNKFFIFILCLCCALTVAQATGEDRLNDSDANVFGHVLDKKTGEHLPFKVPRSVRPPITRDIIS